MLYTPSLLNVLSLAGILARQWWRAEHLRAWQDARLRRLADHAYRNVEFYRQRWDAAGVTPARIRSVDDLVQLPIIPGPELKSSPYPSLIARGIDPARCRVNTTSGSTGRPLAVTYRRADHFMVIKAMSVRHYLAHGVRLRDRMAGFTPNPDACRVRGWYERLGFWQRLMLCTNAEAGEWIDPLMRARPSVIAGSPMSLRELADELRETGAVLPPARLVFSSGARLDKEDRYVIERKLGGRTYDVYGSYEGGFIAWQCPRCPGYHINADTVLVEVLDEQGRPVGPGGTGEVVITNLYSSAMPFIRYRLGDVATLSASAPVCGRGLPLLEQIWGRDDDSVCLPSGRKVGPYPVYMSLLEEEAVREWRLVQHADASCTLQIVPRDQNLPAAKTAELKARMSAVLGREVPVRIQCVERIDRDLKTKWKTIVRENKTSSSHR